MPAPKDPRPHRAGYVALCGRPNVGKSTLLNALVGEPIAVASRLPQTTRERLLAVWTTGRFQAVLVDTPGLHTPRSALNRFMVREALRAARDVDLVLMLAEAPRLPDDAAAAAWRPGAGATRALRDLEQLGPPIALVLTKCDRLGSPEHALPVIEAWRSLGSFVEVIATSAVRGRGIDRIATLLAERLPSGPPLYDEDAVSLRALRWHAAELIRAQLFERLGDELPYQSTVVIDAYKELAARDRVEATVHVERASQRAIVIGEGGAMIKAISQAARAQIAALSGRPCDLFLTVKVSPGWSDDPIQVAQLGYVDLDEGAPRR